MKISAIILAAGYSSRTAEFQVHKMELKIEGKSLLLKTLETYPKYCEDVTVVAGYQPDRITGIVKNLGETNGVVNVVINKNFEKGMFTSIRAGLSHSKGEKIFITPGDYPLVLENTIEKMLLQDGEVVVPVYKGRRGHPVLISKNVAKEILQAPEDSNLREVLTKQEIVYAEVDDEGILMDVDTMEDYQRAITLWERRKK